MKTALVTGANKGMGFEIVRQLAKQGNKVILGARDETKGKEAISKLKEDGVEVDFIKLDMDSEESIKNAAQLVSNKYGKLDILINNAGVNPEYPAGVLTIDALPTSLMKSIFDSNFFGPFIAIREFLPLLKKSDAGRIVNVSSTLGSITGQTNLASPYYGVNTLAYNISKTALNALTVQVAKQVENTNVKINSVCPGWVKTDMGSDYAPKTIEEGVVITLELANIDKNGANGGSYVKQLKLLTTFKKSDM
jgi:NAD(P)-dependent dehydrogenase (short-subunit alcohol dehydrogenase family)